MAIGLVGLLHRIIDTDGAGVGMDWRLMMEFVKSMGKSVAVMAVVLLEVILSFFVEVGVGGRDGVQDFQKLFINQMFPLEGVGVGMDWRWMMEFVKSMGKSVAATAVVLLAVILSFF